MKDADKNDISVILFQKQKPDSPTHIQEGQYDDNGYLENWPIGFFEPDLISDVSRNS